MVFNFKKRAQIPEMRDLIVPDVGAMDPEFGMYQKIVDAEWMAGGSDAYSTQQEMVDAKGGVEAIAANARQAIQYPGGSQELTDFYQQVAATKPFNFKKQSQIPMGQVTEQPPQPVPTQFAPTQPAPPRQNLQFKQPPYQPIQFDFRDHGELKMYLDEKGERGKRGFKEVIQDLSYNKIPDLKEAVEYYYKMRKDVQKGVVTSEDLLDYVHSDIYELLPENLTGGGIVRKNRAAEVQEAIKKMAEKNTKKKDIKAFNMSKTAQHKTQENVIMYGPQQVRKVDPFSRQPVSDWHIVERNKGFGLVVDDVWNIDYETIWRENIMDKFYRPYKDKEGNWVGGYINKRFEIDRNIPASTNMQLKPGQTRRPILPEYGNTESRLQAARAAGDIAGANDTSKPFNWKEASFKKKS